MGTSQLHKEIFLRMVLSYMNFQLDILFEGPVAFLTLDDYEIGDDGLLHLHGLLFDGEVRTLHRLLLDLKGSCGGGGRCGRQVHCWTEGFHWK